jgi:ABC-type phosphate/phosphonate transport system permease subunit
VIVLILITVALIDQVSRWLRLRLIGGTTRRV